MMNKLEKLIHNFCPDGVEFCTFKEVMKYEQPTKYIVKNTDYNDSFETPVLTAGQTFILGYTNEKNGIYNASKHSPVIIFDDFTGAFKWIDFPFKVKSSAIKILTVNESYTYTTLRYVYHVMGKIAFSSNEHKRLWIGIYSSFKLPLPPYPVQEEIVRILDNFTELITELTAELTARRKQYEYYRNILLNCDKSTPVYELSDIAQYSKSRIDAKEVDENSYIGVDNLLQNKKGKTTSLYVPSEGRLIKYNPGDILIGNIRPYLRKIWFSDIEGGTNGDVLTIQVSSEKVLPRYLFFQLSSESFFSYDIKYSKGAKMPRGNKEAIMRYKISVPPLEEQQRIVDILDRFDKLCNDISEGLPAEIEARQKQYEYYRDKLLTFKPLEEVK